MSIKVAPIKEFVCSEYVPSEDKVIDTNLACKAQMSEYVNEMSSKRYSCEITPKTDSTRGFYEVRCKRDESNQLLLTVIGFALLIGVGIGSCLMSITAGFDPNLFDNGKVPNNI